MTAQKDRVPGGKASGGTPTIEPRQEIEEKEEEIEEVKEEVEEEREEELQRQPRRTSEVIYDGKYVVVRRRERFFNAYVKNDPDKAPSELTALALDELLKNREKIKADGIIWLNGPGFRLGVPPDKRVLVMPTFNKKAILLDNLVSFIKHIIKEKK